MAVASARPQVKVGLPHREGVVILAFDASNSMRATDLAPTRMEAAKVAAKEFIDTQPNSIKIGVVAFNNGACYPTTDERPLRGFRGCRSPDARRRDVAGPGNLCIAQRNRG
jgi:Ca-activated chloride channel family protein